MKQVFKKLHQQALQNALLCNYNMLSNTTVTLPAWVGKHVEGLPKQHFTKEK